MLTPQASEATLLLDDTSTCDTLPQWSPDHQRIAFTRSTSTTSALWIMNRDGTGASMVSSRLTGRMAWSSDGTRIAGMGNTGPVHQIFVINLSDRKLQQVTTDGSTKNDPAWCNNRLAFWSGDTVDTQQIYTVDPAYPDAQWKKVTRSPRGVNDPAWSPDCTKIAYTDDKNIWVTGADGTGAKQLTSGAARDMDPNWSHNGDWITFVRGASEHPRIWAMRADGKDAKRIGPDKDIGHPDWY
jgi:Tol biopolymer transport system component